MYIRRYYRRSFLVTTLNLFDILPNLTPHSSTIRRSVGGISRAVNRNQMAKKRKTPMKRARDRDSVVKQLNRYEKNLTNWISKSITAAAKIKAYRDKVDYYRKRLADEDAQRIQELEASERLAQRELRNIQLDGD